MKSFIHGLGFLDLKHIFMLRKANFFWKLRSTDSLLLSNLFCLCSLTGIIFGFRAWIRIYLCFRTFMKLKSLFSIDFHAFVLSIMNVNLLLCYLFSFILV